MQENIKENLFLSKLKRYLKILFVILFIIFEEIIWNKFGKPLYEKVKSLKVIERFKIWLEDIEHRYLILFIFLVPFFIMELLSLLAIKAFATGLIITGIGLYVIKILLTAPVVVIFNVAKKQLVSFFLIRYSYGIILNFKRSNIFREVKTYIKFIKNEIIKFKDEYLNGNISLKDELEKIYFDIKYYFLEKENLEKYKIDKEQKNEIKDINIVNNQNIIEINSCNNCKHYINQFCEILKDGSIGGCINYFEKK